MQTYCDRCNEGADHPIAITTDAEIAELARDLGYRSVCSGCYEDLVAEAAEARELHGDDRKQRTEERIAANLALRIELADGSGERQDVVTDEVSVNGVCIRPTELLECGSVVCISANGAPDVDAVAIVEVVWRDDAGLHAGLHLVETSERWAQLVERHVGRDLQ
jgi:hypothetical protein